MKIVNQIINDPRFVHRKPYYVSVYEDTQVYGGPEEGGWWVTQTILVGSIEFPTQRMAEGYLETAKQEAEEKTKENSGRAWKRLPESEGSSMYPEGYIPKGFSDDSTYYAVVESVSGSREKRLTDEDLTYS
jgi:hypothetical protein